jgi:hypothetical protein
VYILGSVHIAVIFVIKHLVTKVTRRYIDEYILGSVHIAVIFVIKLSGRQVT